AERRKTDPTRDVSIETRRAPSSETLRLWEGPLRKVFRASPAGRTCPRHDRRIGGRTQALLGKRLFYSIHDAEPLFRSSASIQTSRPSAQATSGCCSPSSGSDVPPG